MSKKRQTAAHCWEMTAPFFRMEALQLCRIPPEDVLPETTVERALKGHGGSACLFPPAYDARLVKYLERCSWRTIRSRLSTEEVKILGDYLKEVGNGRR